MQQPPHPKRSKLTNAAFIKWIRSRYQNKNRKNPHYLYFPQQLIKQTSIQKIFIQCDTDGSGGLSRIEIFQMFSDLGINITIDDLNQLYDSVELNLEELDCNMFKKCALSEQSNRVFRKIANKFCNNSYYPHNFTKMIIYIVFLSKRRELLKQATDPSTTTPTTTTNSKLSTKIQMLQKVLKLNDLAVNNQKVDNYLNKYKENIRNKVRDIWEKVNQRYQQEFPFQCKREQEFYWYCYQNFGNKQL